jgi:putative nucleotidyltransferase with HDIG domain
VNGESRGRLQSITRVINILLPTAIFLLNLSGWLNVIRQNNALETSAILAYQHTQTQIVKSIATSANFYINDTLALTPNTSMQLLKDEVYQRYILPVHLLDRGVAWVFTPDRVIFAPNFNIPEVYRNQNSAQVLAELKKSSAADINTTLNAITQGTQGTGKLVWSPERGLEIAAWEPFAVGQEIWVAGMSTPLSEILDSIGEAKQAQSSSILMLAVSLASMGLVMAWSVQFVGRQRLDQTLQRTNRDLELRVKQRTGELIRVNEALQKEINGHEDDERELTRVNKALQQEIIERAQAETQLTYQLKRQEALRKMDTMIASGGDLSIPLHYLLEQTCNLLEVDATDILILDPVSMRLEVYDSVGFNHNLHLHHSFRMGDSWAGEAAYSRTSLIIPNIFEDKHGWTLPPYWVEEGFQAYFGVPLKVKGDIKGVLELFHRSPINPSREWINYMDTLAGQAAIAIDSSELFERLQQSNASLVVAYDATLEGWSQAVEMHDKETGAHGRRLADKTVVLARKMGVSSDQLVHISRGALLHDIGKMGVPDYIIMKPGTLNLDETNIMRQHPVKGYKMLARINYLRPAIDIPYCHHERWDGSGYPRGLKGEDIPLSARIFMVVDVWDALTNDRYYRAAWSPEKTLAYIMEKSGTLFDPEVVEYFIDLPDIKPFLTNLSDLPEQPVGGIPSSQVEGGIH